MRILTCLTLLVAAQTLSHQSTAFAQNDQAWQTCIGTTASPDDRVSACSVVIDARKETGPRLAAADYSEVIGLAPTDARGWRNRGLIRLYQGDNKGGLADYDKGLQYDPADAFSRNNRGQARMRLGDKAGAIADFREALELRPDLRTVRENL